MHNKKPAGFVKRISQKGIGLIAGLLLVASPIFVVVAQNNTASAASPVISQTNISDNDHLANQGNLAIEASDDVGLVFAKFKFLGTSVSPVTMAPHPSIPDRYRAKTPGTIPAGVYDIQFRVRDTDGNITDKIVANVTYDTSNPVVNIDDPNDSQVLSGNVDITGEASDTHLKRYRVQIFNHVDPQKFKNTDLVSTLANIPVSPASFSGTFATWDTTTVPDGLYDIRVQAKDMAGNIGKDTVMTVEVDNSTAQIRVHKVIDANADALPFFGETHEAGWTMRLYDDSWNPANSGEGGTNEVVTTGLAYSNSATFHVAPGSYYLCEVQQPGYAQSLALTITSYVTFEDNSVANQSGQGDEAGLCVSVENINSGQITSHVFGNNVPGEIRVHKVIDLNHDNWPNFLGDETHTAGWDMRLYRINHLGEWKFVEQTTTTDKPYHQAANFNVAAGEYRLCEVKQDEFAQTFTRRIDGWYNLPEVGVANESGQVDEAEDCAPVTVTSDGVTSYIFGNAPDLTPPDPAAQSDQTLFESDLSISLSDWLYWDDVNDSPSIANTVDLHEITDNPTPTAGDIGAVKLSVEPGEKWNLSNFKYSGIDLPEIAEIGFRVRTTDPGKAYLNLDIDFHKSALSTVGYQGRLVYVPSVTADTWSDEEAVASNSMWSWSRYDENGNQWPDGETSALRSWEEIINAFPHAEISAFDNLGIGGLHLRADGDGGASMTHYDFVYLATDTENIRYNFEIEEEENNNQNNAPQTPTPTGNQNTNNNEGNNNPEGFVAPNFAFAAPAADGPAVLGDNTDNNDGDDEGQVSSATTEDGSGNVLADQDDSNSFWRLTNFWLWLLPLLLLLFLIIFLLARRDNEEEDAHIITPSQ